MFTIKICGITRPEDALAAVAAGADALGLNFYAKSARAIDLGRARSIIAAVPPGVIKVGVFVYSHDSPDHAAHGARQGAAGEGNSLPSPYGRGAGGEGMLPEEVCRISDALGLDLIQLHGDEPPEYLAKLGGRPVIKAFRAAGADGLRAILDYLAACRELGCLPRLVLLDAPVSQGFGGSGKLADWSLAREYQALAGLPPLVLAGGLRPENVAEAILATNVRAIDTASGVESQPGIKDSAAINAFVSAAKEALALQAPFGSSLRAPTAH